MKYSFRFRKITSVTTLASFLVSLLSPFANIAFAVSPTVDLSYSANPTGTGTMTITAIYSETIVGSPLISIDQPGSSDVLDDTMTDLGTGTIFTYDYTVNLDDGSNYMDGSANVSLTGAYNGSGEIADPPSNATFVITTLDTTPPVITLVGLSVVSGEIGYGGYSDDGASWADNVDGSGFIFSNSGYFDNNTLGTYVIGYEYTDGAGNIGTGVTRTVNIVDTTAPVVTLSGVNPVTVTVGGVFTDDGATWTDAYAGSGFIASYNSGSVDVNNTGSYTVAYVYGDTSGNTGSVSRVVNVVNAAGNPNIRNATIAPPSTNSLYSNSNQEAGRIALSAAGENIRVQKIVFANSGSSDLSHIINASLVDVGDGSIIPAIYTISGATITFDSMNYSINAFFTKNVKVMLDLSSVVNAYGQTIHLNTNSGAINIIRESDGATLVADDTLLANSSIKTYTLSVVPPTITLTGSTSLIQNEKLATLRIENFDTDTGVTLSGFTLQFTTNFNGSFVADLCLRDLGSLASCGSPGTTMTPVTVTETGMISTIGYGGLFSNQTIARNGGYIDLEIYLDNAPLWTNGNIVNINVRNLEYSVDPIVFNESYIGSSSAATSVSWASSPDTTPPVITLVGLSVVSGEIGYGGYSDDGASWADNVDGSGFIFSNSGYFDNNTLGTYVIGYEYTDGAGNIGTGVTRTVNIVDTTAPFVYLSGSSPVTVVQGQSFVDAGANWGDNADGNGFIAGYNSGSVNTNVVGSYTVRYVFIDSSGNMGSIDRVVNVIAAPDTIRPVITLSGVSVVNVEFISPFVDDGASWTDNVDGSGVIAAFTSGSINTGALGSYVVSYGYTDGARNAGTGVTRTVNVVDTTAPVVTLSGATPVSITVGGSFIDNGANWTDAHAGSGFIGAFNSGSVNVNNTGSYTVAYVYGDASGNTGSLSRVVNVIAAPARVVGGGGGGGSSSSYGSYNQAYLPISRNAPSNTTTLANNITRNLGIALLQRNLNNATSTFEADPKTDPAKTTPIVIFQERSFANSINIDDISESIAERIIKVLMTRGVLKNSNKFEPKRDITRAEFVKILTLVLGLEETFINVKMPFGDIGGDSEFRRYIMVALELGWINPNQKSFRPNDTITLSEVNKIISAAIGIGDANAGVKESENVSREEAILLINGSIVIN